MNLQKLKINLPAAWKEASRSGNENQLIARIYHINPLHSVDPKIFGDQVISSSETSQVVKLGVTTPSGTGGSYGDFIKGMKGFVASGFAPTYMTNAYLDDLHKKLSQTPGAEVPDESDIALDISIVQYKNKNDAKTALENFGAIPMGNFDAKIPGTDMSFMDILSSDVLKSQASKEQLESMKAMSKIIKEKMPEMKAKVKETGLQYKKGKLLGYDAIFIEMPNPVPPPKAPQPVPKGKFQGGGSRGNDVTIPLPKVVTPYSKKITMYQAVLVDNFVVSGGLISAASMLSSGSTPCYSLTKTEKRTDTVEGVKSTYIIASASNFAAEGYLCRETAEKALKAVLEALKK